MQTITKTAKTIEQYADEVTGSSRCFFQSKETRERVVWELKSRGFKVKRTSSSGSQLHPEYVTDFVGTYETGFGNTDYQTRWGRLYSITVLDRKITEADMDYAYGVHGGSKM